MRLTIHIFTEQSRPGQEPGYTQYSPISVGKVRATLDPAENGLFDVEVEDSLHGEIEYPQLSRPEVLGFVFGMIDRHQQAMMAHLEETRPVAAQQAENGA